MTSTARRLAEKARQGSNLQDGRNARSRNSGREGLGEKVFSSATSLFSSHHLPWPRQSKIRTKTRLTTLDTIGDGERRASDWQMTFHRRAIGSSPGAALTKKKSNACITSPRPEGRS